MYYRYIILYVHVVSIINSQLIARNKDDTVKWRLYQQILKGFPYLQNGLEVGVENIHEDSLNPLLSIDVPIEVTGITPGVG